jgi:hypothetical protein
MPGMSEREYAAPCASRAERSRKRRAAATDPSKPRREVPQNLKLVANTAHSAVGDTLRGNG